MGFHESWRSFVTGEVDMQSQMFNVFQPNKSPVTFQSEVKSPSIIEEILTIVKFQGFTKVYTEMRFNLCMWLSEISSCSCLSVLPVPAWVLLNKICK